MNCAKFFFVFYGAVFAFGVPLLLVDGKPIIALCSLCNGMCFMMLAVSVKDSTPSHPVINTHRNEVRE